MNGKNGFPLIERNAIPEIYVDGAYRLDNLGGLFHKYYFRYERDPDINSGLIFRVPVLRTIWTREHFILNAGNGLVAMRTGEQDIPHIIPEAFRDRSGMQ